MITRPKPSKEISAIIDDLLKKKEDLVFQCEKQKQMLATLESSSEIYDVKNYIEWLEDQLCFYTKRSDMLNRSISFLTETFMTSFGKICCVIAHIQSLKADISEMKALCSRRLYESNFHQVNLLSMRIQHVYDKIQRLEEKKKNLNECCIEYDLYIEKLTQKLLLINDCKSSIEDIIVSKEHYIGFTEKQIASLKRSISSIESEINEIDKKVKFGNDRIVENKRYYAKREQIAQLHRAEMYRLLDIEQKQRQERQNQAQKQLKIREVESEIQRMKREEDELMKAIEEDERKLAERKKKLIEMQSNKTAKQHKLLEFLN